MLILAARGESPAPVGRLVPLLVLGAFVLPGPSATAAAARAKRAMTAEDVVELRRVSDPRTSPDGSRVAFVVTQRNAEDDAFNEDLYLVHVEDGELLRLTHHPRADQHPRWSPRGGAIAFLSDRGDEAQVFLMSTRGGEPRPVTAHGTSVTGFEWAPDGKTIYFVAPVPRNAAEEATARRDRPRRDDDGGGRTPPKDVVVLDADHRYAQIWSVDVGNGEVTQVTRESRHVTHVQPSPGGGQLAFIARTTPRVADVLTQELYVVAVRGGTPRRLTDNAVGETHPRWSRDESHLGYLAEADGNPVAGPSRIHVIPVDGGEPRVLARGFDGYIRDFRWAAGGFLLYADHGVERHVYRLDLHDEDLPEPVTEGDGLFGPFSASRRSRMAFLHESPEHPADVWWQDGPSQPPRQLTRLNPQADEWALGSVETIRWRSPDGLEVEGLVVYPVDYEAGRRYPTILDAHGGPESAYTRGFLARYTAFPHVYAAAGYVTLMPNFRGSSNYGATFAQANRTDVGGGDYADCLSGLDHLLTEGVADPDRLAIKGWSYGGYMSGWAIGHTDRFKAAAYGAGLSNAVSYYGTADIQFSRENLHGETPYTNRAQWVAQSPLTYVDRVTTPTLIFHGEKDGRVPLGQSLEFYAALRAHDVPSRLVVYPDQPHGVRVPSYQLDKMTREVEWFEQHVLGKPLAEANH